MKKLTTMTLTIILALSMVFILAACGGGNDTAPETKPAPEQTPEEPKETTPASEPEPESEMNQVTQFKYYDDYFAIDIDGNLWGFDSGLTHILDNVESIDNIYGRSMFALKTDGSLWAWGENNQFLLGDGTTETQLSPVHIIDDVKSFEQVFDNEGYVSTYVVKTDGSLWAWGGNAENARIGDGTDEVRTSPVHIMDGVETLYLTYYHNFVIKTDGSFWGWSNSDTYVGKVGFGESNGMHLSPVHLMDDVVEFFENATTLSVIKKDGSLWSWGDLVIAFGADGRQLQTTGVLNPVHIMDDVEFYFNNPNMHFAIQSDGSLWSWGYTVSCLQHEADDPVWLGNGTEDGSLRPVHILDGVDSLISVTSFARINPISVDRTIFTIKKDGSLWAWGDNTIGLIGDGTNENRTAPVHVMDDVASFVTFTESMDIATESYRIIRSLMVIKTDGSLWAWGENDRGQLGDGTKENRQSPVHIADNVKELLPYGIFIKTDNSLWVFGENTPDGSLTPFHVIDDVDTVIDNFGVIDSIIKTDGTLWRVWSDTPKQFMFEVPA